MAKLIRTIAVVVLLAVFCVPAAGYVAGLFGDGSVSESENRRLADFPRWSDATSFRDYTRRIDKNLKDRFGARTLMIDIARNVRDNLGEDPPQVVRGKEDWLYLGQTGYREEFEGRGRWKPRQVEQWDADLSAAEGFFAQRGIPFVAAIAPDKARIYPEYLPDDWTRGRRRFVDALQAKTSRDVFVDLETAILEAKASGEQVYYRRDTHWSPSGSHAAMNVWLRALGREPSSSDDAPVGEHRREALGDLERMSGSTTPAEPLSRGRTSASRKGYKPIFPDIDEAGVPVRGAMATKIITDDVDDAEGTLVIIGDSFADFAMKQIMPHYARVVKVHHGAEAFTIGTDEIMSYEPDAVLFLVVERDAARKARPMLIGATVVAPN